MTKLPLKSTWLRRRFKVLLGWLVLMALSIAALAIFQHKSHLVALKKESYQLLRVASQRAVQHDAHLNALAVIADSDINLHRKLFLDISNSVHRFYPRIHEIQLVRLKDSQPLIGSKPLEDEISLAISAATQDSPNIFTLLSHPTRKEYYFLIKRRPGSGEAIYALVLGINAKYLLISDSTSNTSFWSRENVAVRLSLPNGDVIVGPEQMDAPQISQTLPSYTQPLRLDISIKLGVDDLLPPLKVLGTMLIASILYFVALLALWQKERTRAAEQMAKLREIETQLTHASRVNAMGEMASGMAHELTQPLTAILAQSQAGLRFLAQNKMDELEAIFHDNVLQSRRASSILERLRNWSRPQREGASNIDLLDALHNIHKLLTSEANQRRVSIKLHLPQQSVMVSANQVEIEQVIYNLVRNGFEALENTDNAQIDVSLKASSEQAILEVSDNGRGVPVDIIPQLFTPFYTTRDNGTGLGLTLSQRLVERANGDIAYVEGDTGAGATFRVVLPLVTQPLELAS